MIKSVLRAASTLKNTDGEKRKFSMRNLDLSLLKRNVLREVMWLAPFVYSQLCLVITSREEA